MSKQFLNFHHFPRTHYYFSNGPRWKSTESGCSFKQQKEQRVLKSLPDDSCPKSITGIIEGIQILPGRSCKLTRKYIRIFQDICDQNGDNSNVDNNNALKDVSATNISNNNNNLKKNVLER